MENNLKINIDLDSEEALNKIKELNHSAKRLTLYALVFRGHWIKILSLLVESAILAVLIWK